MAIERVVLVGFMASGKSEVGRGLAERLGWRHIDLDREIEYAFEAEETMGGRTPSGDVE